MVGKIISHYEIVEKIGSGGMGTVYKARDTKLNRFVALKFLHRSDSLSPVDRRRFFREAEAASRISHPNVCVIHEIDEVENSTFIVMEFVEGVTLLQWTKENLATGAAFREYIPRALRIAVQIADGLQEAHQIGIIHRDVKSENVIVTPNGRPKLMDFGLAKLRGTSTLTTKGSHLGTICYMSPEQVQGLGVDHRTDLFSFGVICYEMFTGIRPFRGEHEATIIYEILNVDPPRALDVQALIGPELDNVIMRCIAKDPNDRYQSMGDVQKGLEFTLASSEADKPRLPASEPEKTKEQTKAISKKAFDGRRTHILIVEDDASVRRGLQELLSSEGYDVRTAEDGVHAVSRINAEHPDLVLLDINLPRLNGFEVLRRAKESGYSGPIIMLTARGEQVDKVMGLEIGAVDYVTKPFQAREVVARVRAQLRASQMASRKRPTSSEKRGRRTMCVMFTDMKDFSKIVNRDERKGLSLLREQNRRIARVARRYSGEVIEVIGDAHVISFKSALQAVECGVAIQDSIHLYNRQRVTSDHIRVRIGINVGDVMEEEGKLRGDTVNIAARLQQISRPGCVTISQSVYESIKGRVKVPITKVGQKKVKNIRQPVMIYQARKKVWNSRPT